MATTATSYTYRIDHERATALVTSQRGRIVGLTFLKADGSTRRMSARLGVNAHLAREAEHTGTARAGLLTLFDMKAKGYRSVRLDRLLALRVAGVSYTVTHEHGAQG